jgi:hypothetical protein
MDKYRPEPTDTDLRGVSDESPNPRLPAAARPLCKRRLDLLILPSLTVAAWAGTWKLTDAAVGGLAEKSKQHSGVLCAAGLSSVRFRRCCVRIASSVPRRAGALRRTSLCVHERLRLVSPLVRIPHRHRHSLLASFFFLRTPRQSCCFPGGCSNAGGVTLAPDSRLKSALRVSSGKAGWRVGAFETSSAVWGGGGWSQEEALLSPKLASEAWSQVLGEIRDTQPLPLFFARGTRSWGQDGWRDDTDVVLSISRSLWRSCCNPAAGPKKLAAAYSSNKPSSTAERNNNV